MTILDDPPSKPGIDERAGQAGLSTAGLTILKSIKVRLALQLPI
jgi:hypothetical protein